MMKCEAICYRPATHVLLYGCLYNHITERKLCWLHLELYEKTIIKCACGNKIAETLTGKLP